MMPLPDRGRTQGWQTHKKKRIAKHNDTRQRPVLARGTQVTGVLLVVSLWECCCHRAPVQPGPTLGIRGSPQPLKCMLHEYRVEDWCGRVFVGCDTVFGHNNRTTKGKRSIAVTTTTQHCPARVKPPQPVSEAGRTCRATAVHCEICKLRYMRQRLQFLRFLLYSPLAL